MFRSTKMNIFWALWIWLNEHTRGRIFFLATAIFLVAYLGQGIHSFGDFKFYVNGIHEGAPLNPNDQWIYSVGVHYLFLNFFKIPPYDIALVLYLALYAFTAAALISLWADMIQADNFILFAMFCFLAFKGPINIAISVLNAELFMQFFIWLALYFFIIGKNTHFLVILFIASMFKFYPAALALILILYDRKYISRVIIFLILVALYALISYTVGLDHYEMFLSRFVHQGTHFSPLLCRAFNTIGFDVAKNSLLMYTLLAVPIFAISLYLLIRYRASKDFGKTIFTMAFASVFMILTPREESYAVIMILPAAYFLAINMPDKLRMPLILFFCMNLLTPYTQYLSPLFQKAFAHSVSPMIILTWILYCYLLKGARK